MNETDPHGWHLKKEIQLGHIITTVTVAISAVVYIQKIEQRVAVMESEVMHQKERDAAQDKMSAESFSVVRAQLERIDAKLDRLIEEKR